MTQPPEPPESDLPPTPPNADGDASVSDSGDASASDRLQDDSDAAASNQLQDDSEPSKGDQPTTPQGDEDEWAEIWELEPEPEPEPVPPPLPEPRRRRPRTATPSSNASSAPSARLTEKSALTRLFVRFLRTLSRGLEWTAVVLETDPLPDESANPIIRLFQRATTDGQPVAEGVWEGWTSRVMPQIRAVLPRGLNERLSDRALTGILAGTLVALFVVLPSVAPRGPQPETQISEAPPTVDQPTEEAPTTLPPEVGPPAPETPTEAETEPEPEGEPTPTVEPEPEVEPEPPVEPEPEVSPTPSPMPSPSPAPAPPAVLTPEQSLVASIQKRVAEVGDRYTQGLVVGVRANFRQTMLTIRLSDAWYDLPYAQQDKLAADLLKQANRLDFSKVELGDRIGYRLARNPVVGDAMVILRREKANFVP